MNRGTGREDRSLAWIALSLFSGRTVPIWLDPWALDPPADAAAAEGSEEPGREPGSEPAPTEP